MALKRISSVIVFSLILILALYRDYTSASSGLSYNINEISGEAFCAEKPEVILHQGTEATSTIYANATSAYVTVDAYANVPSSVGTSTSSFATRHPFQRKAFYANERYWVFYSDGANIVFKSSIDGKMWSVPSNIRLGGQGGYFSLHFDGENVHLVYAYLGSFTYRKGIPNSNGTISWGTEYTVKSTDSSENRFLTNQLVKGNLYQLPTLPVSPSTNETTSVVTGSTAVNNYFIINPFTQTTVPYGTSLPTTIQLKGWCSPTVTKTYPKGYWILYYKLKNRAAYAHAGTIFVRYWKSNNTDMNGATALTDWLSFVSVSFSANSGEVKSGSAAVYVPNEILLDNEYLYVEFAWNVTAAAIDPTAGFYFVADEVSEYVKTPTHQYYDPSITVDSSGYPLISYLLRPSDTLNQYIRSVVKATTTYGNAWNSLIEFDSSPTSAAYSSSIVALTNGKAYVVYSYNSSILRGFLLNGTSWSSEETISDYAQQSSPYFSVVAQGDNVHVVYLRQITYQIRYRQRTYGVGWGTEVVVQDAVTSSSAPVLSIDTATNNLYVFWAGSPEPDYIYLKKCFKGTWDANLKIWIEGQATQSLTSGNDLDEAFYGSLWKSQSFTSLKDDKIWAIQIYAKRAAGFTSIPVNVAIYHADAEGKPTGTSLGYGVISSFFGTSYSWRSCTFSTPISVSANRKYCLVISAPAGSLTNYYHWAVDSTSPQYINGYWAYSANGGLSWTSDMSKDAFFQILFESTLTGNDRLACFYRTLEARTSLVYSARTQGPYSIKIASIKEELDCILKIVNNVANAWNIRLRAYDQSNIGSLQNCTIYFHNNGAVSRQICIYDGIYSNKFGNWSDLSGSSTVYIAMTISEMNTEKSDIYAYLEILVPKKSVYNLLIIKFEIA